MKTRIKECIGIAVLFCTTVVLAGQTQHIAPGEVPEGITAEDWDIIQEAYLKASNTDAVDSFGGSVDIFGDTIVIGAGGEDSAATGVDGNQNDNSAHQSGAAYVFVRNGIYLNQQAYLKASNADGSDWEGVAGDAFGSAIAISGDTIVVGAYNESSSASGVNGNQTDNSVGGAGATYVFVRNGNTWSQQAYLKASNTHTWDRFGIAVDISGDTIVVGAHFEDSSTTGVNGDQFDNSAYRAGAAYVFVRNGTIWSQQAYLKASNTDSEDLFGSAVAISGDTIVIGAPWERSNAIGVNGNQSDNSAADVGAAYVFVRNGTTWSQEAYLKASNSEGGLYGDEFGCSVAISGDTIVVGADGEDSNATGIDGNQADNSTESAGAAYVFARSGTTWSQQAYLKASNTDADDLFGGSVDIFGDTIVIGARGEDSAATGVDGNQNDNSAHQSGAAYVFVRNGIYFNQQAYLKASNADGSDWEYGAGDEFGSAIAISGDTIILGASGEDSNATGINGNKDDNNMDRAGAAFVFTDFVPEDYEAIITDCYTPGSGFVLEWIPASGFGSVIKCSTDLRMPFTDLSAPLPYPVNSYTDTVSNGKCFYKVDLQP